MSSIVAFVASVLLAIRAGILSWLWDVAAGDADSVGSCANRRWSKKTVGSIEFIFIRRYKGMADGYSREELVEMLETVRKHEHLMGWKVPEPAAAQGTLRSEST